jgi:hypothetical protein
MENYQTTLEGSVISPSMTTQHGSWAKEVAPSSHRSMIIGDIEEAATMSTPRTGFSAYRFETPPTYGTPSQHAEGDDYRHNYSSRNTIKQYC